MNWIELTGHLGALLTSITFIPQVYKAWQTKSVGDLSLTMILIVFISTLVWLTYAISLMLWPVILANVVVSLLSVILIVFKLTFSKQPSNEQ
ncbi:MAG: SemiSWEET family sugar transporter [Cyclobacteriaceae bacterium]